MKLKNGQQPLHSLSSLRGGLGEIEAKLCGKFNLAEKLFDVLTLTYFLLTYSIGRLPKNVMRCQQASQSRSGLPVHKEEVKENEVISKHATRALQSP